MEPRKPHKNHTQEDEHYVWLPENSIEIERNNVLATIEKICTGSRHPYLTLRLFMHVLCGIDRDGNVPVSARRLAKKIGAHYDTTCKCLKYLREIGVMRIER